MIKKGKRKPFILLMAAVLCLFLVWGQKGSEDEEAFTRTGQEGASLGKPGHAVGPRIKTVDGVVDTGGSKIARTNAPDPVTVPRELRFRAVPGRKLVRGAKSTLFYPEMRIQERAYTPGTVFNRTPLQNVRSAITGPLSMSDLTQSAVEAALDLHVIEEFLDSGAQYLPLPINGKEQVLLSVERTIDRGEHTITLIGNSGDRSANETFLVFHDGVMYGTVHEVHPFRVIEYTAGGNGTTAIRTLDVNKEIYGTCNAEFPVDFSGTCASGCGHDHSPSSSVAAVAADLANEGARWVAHGEGAGQGFDEASNAIDVVMTYLPDAVAELGGIAATEARIIAHLDTTTQLFQNSQLDTVFHLLGTGLETLDLTASLVAPDAPADHNSMQAFLGADLSGKVGPGQGGRAWLPGGSSIYEGFIIGAGVPASTGSSFPHEICHNFGAGHSFGDGGYRNTVPTEIHYGWRMRLEGYNYRTVMSYTSNPAVRENAANGVGPRIGYLSDPDQTYDAAVSGGRTISVALGAASGFDGSSDPYVDPSLLYGGRDATFSYSDNGSPGDYTDETFTYVSGGIITNGYNGTYPGLAANNNQRVSEFIPRYAVNGERVSNQFVLQPSVSYSSSEEMTFALFAGDHHDRVEIALYKGGQEVSIIEAEAPAFLHNFRFRIPETGLESGDDYQIVVTPASGPVLQSDLFSLNIFEALPVAYYMLDETSGTVLADSSGNGHDATLLSGALNRPGARHGALEVDADDTNANRGMRIPSSVKAQITNAVTVMFWAFGDDSLPRRTSALTGAGFNLHLPWEDGRIYWDAGGATRDRILASTDAADYQGKWNHYAFTKNVASGEMKLFINGVERAGGSGKTNALDVAGSIYLGSANGSGIHPYDGRFDEVRIYNLALGESKIEELFNAITVPSLYWEGTAGDGLWTNGVNWSTGVIPAAGDVADLNNGDTVELSSGLDLPADARIHLSNATLSIASNAHVRLPTGSTLWINGGTVRKDFAVDTAGVQLGTPGNNATVDLESGSIQLTGGGIAQRVTSVYADLNLYDGDVDMDMQVQLWSDMTIFGDNATIDIGFFNPRESASINFVLDSTGVSPITASGWASMELPEVTVDGSAYEGGPATIPLLTAGTLLETNVNVSVLGFASRGLDTEIVSDPASNEVRLVLRSNGVDRDADGYLDWEEVFMGTDPGNPLSSLALQVGSAPGRVSWTTVAGRTYTVEYRDSLGASAAWKVFQANVPHTEGIPVTVDLEPALSTNGYRVFRIRVSK